MIVGTNSHPKFLELVAELDMMPCFVGGILEFLWNFTREFCPQGNIGRFSNRAIARGIGYEGDADSLIAALVRTKWLDESAEHRLLVHDWPDHCGLTIHGKLARARQLFANGAAPDASALHSRDRNDYLQWLKTKDLQASTEKPEEKAPLSTQIPVDNPRPDRGSPNPNPNPNPNPLPSDKQQQQKHAATPVAAAAAPDLEHIAEILHRATPRQPSPPSEAILRQVAEAMGDATVAELEAWLADRVRSGATEPRRYGFWPRVIAEDFRKAITRARDHPKPCAKCNGSGKVLTRELSESMSMAEIDAAMQACECQQRRSNEPAKIRRLAN